MLKLPDTSPFAKDGDRDAELSGVAAGETGNWPPFLPPQEWLGGHAGCDPAAEQFNLFLRPFTIARHGAIF
jgi:hypothetical protein